MLRGNGARRARALAIGTAAAAALLTASTAVADDPASLRGEADALERANASLAGHERSAVLELYSLETRLARADRRVAELQAAADELDRRRAATQRRLEAVRDDLAAAQVNLEERLTLLYVEGPPDPIAILLGAGSLDEALTAFESLGHVARQDKEVVAQVREARAAVKGVLVELERERERLAMVTADAEAARDAVAAAKAERSAYLAELREEQRLNDAELADLLSQAEAAEAKSEEIAAPATPSEPTEGTPDSGSPAPSPPPPSGGSPAGGRKLTVEATGYALRGTTATGIQTSWGVVAVDPSVIPLGTKMFVPGYGEGVAADTGSAVKGNIIDLWFPTVEQAIQWGRRTVTITLY